MLIAIIEVCRGSEAIASQQPMFFPINTLLINYIV